MNPLSLPGLFAMTMLLSLAFPRWGRAAPIDAPEKAMAGASLSLGEALYQQAAKTAPPANLVFSPASIHTALLMASAGARGQTLAQMQAVLSVSVNADPHAAMKPVLDSIRNGNPKAYELTISNDLWLQNGYPIQPDFAKTLKDDYAAEPTALDFHAHPDDSRKTINDAVATQTHDKIKDLLPGRSITPLTRMVLTNAVYFKSNWAEEFEKEQTKDEPFHGFGGATANVPTMHQTHSFLYFENDSLKLLELPYKRHQLSMLIVLPKAAKAEDGSGVAKDLSKLSDWAGQAKPREVTVALPKFKFETTVDLRKDLSDLGMKDAFSDNADFSGIVTQEKLMITGVFHQTMIAVDEAGTEAAAATAVTFGPTAMRQPPKPAEFIADRPFLFAIRHNATGTILFLGRVVKP